MPPGPRKRGTEERTRVTEKRKIVKGREREMERERKRKGEREKERGIEGEREREKERYSENIWNVILTSDMKSPS